MSTPILLVCGPAGSGKDTVAGIIARKHNGICIAQADPMKRLAQKVFGFTDYQLWGPSEARNAPDPRYDLIEAWLTAIGMLQKYSSEWLGDVLPGMTDEEAASASSALVRWLLNVAAAHGIKSFAAKEPQIMRQLTPRYALQTLGTEYGRNFSQDMWVDYAKRAAYKLLNGGYEYKRSYGLIEKKIERAPDYVIITDGRFRNEILSVNGINGITLFVEPLTSAKEYARTIDSAGVSGHVSERELGGIPAHFYSYILGNNKDLGLEVLETTIEMFISVMKANSTIRMSTTQMFDPMKVTYPGPKVVNS